jgi:hypothetical protein
MAKSSSALLRSNFSKINTCWMPRRQNLRHQTRHAARVARRKDTFDMTETNTNADGPKSRNHIVAFVDILGAGQAAISGHSSRLVGEIFRLKRSMETQYQVYSAGPSGTTGTREFKPNLVAFSDCLLLWSAPLDGLDTEQFIRATRDFLGYLCAELGSLLLRDVPFRAGVSEGPMYIYPEYDIYAGRPLVEAAKLESCQEWLGAAMLFADLPDRLIKRPDQIFGAGERSMFDTPGYISEHKVLALNWALSAQEQQGPTYESLKTRLQALQAKACPEAQKKYAPAMLFLATVEQAAAKENMGRTAR